MVDIASITTAETAFMALKHPATEEPMFEGTGDKKSPVGITFHAPGSEAYEAAQAKRTNRSLIRSKKKIEITADLLRADNIGYLADITASFDNLTYSPAGTAKGVELYKALYGDRKYAWVIDQANVFLADWANFTQPSGAPSATS